MHYNTDLCDLSRTIVVTNWATSPHERMKHPTVRIITGCMTITVHVCLKTTHQKKSVLVLVSKFLEEKFIFSELIKFDA
jgi:hypothetical protein